MSVWFDIDELRDTGNVVLVPDCLSVSPADQAGFLQCLLPFFLPLSSFPLTLLPLVPSLKSEPRGLTAGVSPLSHTHSV